MIGQRRLNTRTALGRAIREARKAASWTQKQLSEHTGVTQATVSNIERGLTSPTFDTLLLLCSTLRVDLVLRSRDERPAPAPWDQGEG